MTETSAEIASISPFFIVRDLGETLSFFRDGLAFDTVFSQPDPNPFFAIIRRDGVQLFIKEIGEGVVPKPNSQQHLWAKWDAYIYAPDPDALASEFASRNAKGCGSVQDTEDGLRGFEVQDPNGYVLFFGRPR